MNLWIYVALWVALNMLAFMCINAIALWSEKRWSWREFFTPPWWIDNGEVLLAMVGIACLVVVVLVAFATGDLKIPPTPQQ